MLKRLVNEMFLDLIIETKGPLLIKSGTATVSGPDMTPVRTFRNGQSEVFIPGSSLKGVWRSHFEKIARSLNPTQGSVCNPFLTTRDSISLNNNVLECPSYSEIACGQKFELREKKRFSIGDRSNNRNYHLRNDERVSNELVYRESCPACRLFGSTYFIGRLNLDDAYLAEDSREFLDKRDGVGIDRLTGGAFSKAKFDLEAVSSGVRFKTRVHLRNFECWQLGAVLIILEDLKDGLIRLGSGTSRGLGAVTAAYTELTISEIARLKQPGSRVYGLGAYLSDGSYGTNEEDFLSLSSLPEVEICGIRHNRTFTGELLTELRQSALQKFVSFIQTWTPPAEMEWNYLEWK